MTDRIAERGVWIGNALSSILVAAALWMASTLYDLSETVAVLVANQNHAIEMIVEAKEGIDENDDRITILERLHPEYYTKP